MRARLLVILAVNFFGCLTVQAGPLAPLPPGTLGEVEVQGSGPTSILIIPCMSCRWRQFDTFMERNKDRYTMHAITLPGFGGTQMPDIGFDHPNLEWRNNANAAIGRYLESENLSDVVLLSHSFGTSFAVEVAAAHPERIRALINLDGFIANGHPPRGAEALAGIREQWFEPLRDAEEWRKFNTLSLDDPQRRVLYHGMFMATPKAALISYWSENLFNDLDDSLRKIKAPVLDIKAIRTRTPEEAAEMKQNHQATLKAAGAPKQVKIIWFEGSRHHMLESTPELVDQVVGRYLEGEPLEESYTGN